MLYTPPEVITLHPLVFFWAPTKALGGAARRRSQDGCGVLAGPFTFRTGFATVDVPPAADTGAGGPARSQSAHSGTRGSPSFDYGISARSNLRWDSYTEVLRRFAIDY
jgi:hypothetical protein